MIKSLASEILGDGLLRKHDTVVVGVSGGPDSMALLHVLMELNRSAGWRLNPHIAHLNHGIRGDDAERDAAFVRAAADSLAVPCTVDSRDIPEIARRESTGVEEVARRERYAFFERVCIRVNATVVAVAHHADDNAETVLHRILRGTGLRGLAGIPKSRPIRRGSEIRIVRPLLGVTRQRILAYLADNGVAYRDDRTNATSEAMRNRIRNVLIPQIEADVNPQVRDALTRLSEQAHWLEEFLSETVQRTFETLIVSRTDQQLTLNAAALARKSRIVQTEIIRLAYASFGLGEQDLSFANIVSVLDLVADPVSGKQAQLPGGMTVEKRYHQLICSLPSDEPREDIASEIAVHLPGRTLLPIRRLKIECSIEPVNSRDVAALRRSTGNMEEYVNYDAVSPPLVVRARRSGERFFPLGAPGSKKLSDFLIDAKVDPKDRARVAVLCDQLGPIWIIGHRIDDRVKVTALTKKALRLRATPLEP
ncbi:MAG: tRNA lysidine(34) synthetase TilS [Phycisphaerae bacterium]